MLYAECNLGSSHDEPDEVILIHPKHKSIRITGKGWCDLIAKIRSALAGMDRKVITQYVHDFKLAYQVACLRRWENSHNVY